MGTLQIPEQVGVMILPQCTLFPHGALPLNIFEDRYKALLEDALQGSSMIAIACRGDEDETGLPLLDARPVGTIGLIRACVRQEDDSGQLILHGVIRVRFDEWLDEKPYPFAHISPFIDREVPRNSAEELALRDAVENYTEQLPEELSQVLNSFLTQCSDPVILADLVSHHFVQNPAKRQQILETQQLVPRLKRLTSIVRHLGPP